MSLDPSQAITLFGVQCWDLETEENYGRFQSTATRKLVCNWADRWALVLALTSNSYVAGSGATGGVVANAGATYPYFSALRVNNVKCVGEGPKSTTNYGGPGTDLVSYSLCRMTITYGTLDLGSVNVDYSEDVISVPSTSAWLQFSDGSGDVNAQDSPPYIIPAARITRLVRGAATLPESLIFNALQNPLNSAAFTDPNGNGSFGVGYVLFDGARSVLRLTTSEATLYGQNYNFDIEYAYRVRGLQWDYIMTPSGPKQVKRKDGQPLFGSSDPNVFFNGSY